MSRTKRSPSAPLVAVWMTSWLASSMVMKYRVISVGDGEVLSPEKLPPERLHHAPFALQDVAESHRSESLGRLEFRHSRSSSSPILLVAPMTLVGWTALSVETYTTRATPDSTDRLNMLRVPHTLLLNASTGWSCMSGTCLYAAT